MTRASIRSRAAVCALLALAGTSLAAQSGSAPAGRGGVAGTGAFTLFVENMDRTLAFYAQAFDMEVPALPASGARPYNQPNPRLFTMFDIPNARERHQSARAQGVRTNLEVMEVQDVPHQTLRLRVQDPGAATVVMLVRDVDLVLGGATRAGASVVTPGGKPVELGGGTRAVLIKDVDGRLLELRQPASMPDEASGTGNVIDIRLALAVQDLARSVRTYRDVFGFASDADAAGASTAATRALTGLTGAIVTRARVRAPGSAMWIELAEYSGVDRTPLRMKIQDRGAARLQLRAEQIDALVRRVAAAGLTIVTPGGAAVPIPPNFKGALVADPDNFFLTLFEACSDCAPFTRPAGAAAPAPAAH